MIKTKGMYRGIKVILDTDDETINDNFDYDLSLGRLGLINEDNSVSNPKEQRTQEL